MTFSRTILAIMALVLFIVIAIMSFLMMIREIRNDAKIIVEPKNQGQEDFVDVSSLIKEGEKSEKSKKIGQRFSELLEIDKKYENASPEDFDSVDSLKKFSEDFRDFCATYDAKKKLYYSEHDIRAFISNLATSHIMILQGMSGTGKTSIAVAFQKFIENPVDVIAIQPMWKERSDLLGYYNEFTKKFNETQLLKELYEAVYVDKMCIIVLDEMNIARVEYYFAEFLSMLELDSKDRKIEITNDHWEQDPKQIIDGKLRILENVYFLGTANNDESTFSISDKVYDRAMVINLDSRAEVFEGKKVSPSKISNSQFYALVNQAINSYPEEEMAIINNWVDSLNFLLNKYFSINFGNRMVVQIKRFIPIYVTCGGTKEEAFDDFVSKKILRKLDAKDPYQVNASLDDFIKELDAIFGVDNNKFSKVVLNKHKLGNN